MDAIIQQWDCAPKRIVNHKKIRTMCAATKPSSRPGFPDFPAKECWTSDADTATTQTILEPPVPLLSELMGPKK